jgi:hypothetical protein
VVVRPRHGAAGRRFRFELVTDAASGGLLSGRYRLGELLGTGGSASVFAGVDIRDGSAVALKVLHPHLSDDESRREALFAEARATAGLRHENIVAVLEVGMHEGTRAWIAMELAGGVSLAEHVELHGPLGVAPALAVARGVLRALEAAHEAGIVHRDVSPSNIMVSPGVDGLIGVDDVRLVDFGLADAAGRSTLSTDTLDVVGNVHFLSPEQATGAPIDARGDVYQAGAVLYFALTGTPPFPRATAEETMRAHVSAPPPVPSVLQRRVSRGIDRIVVKAMLKHPGERFASAREMLAAIEALATAPGPEPRTLLLGAPAPRTRDETTRVHALRAPARATTASRVVPAPSPGVPPDAEHRSPAWAILGGFVVLAVAIAWILSATAVAPPRAAEALPASTPSATATATQTPAIVVEQPRAEDVAVPDVAGGTVASAGVLLAGMGLVLGSIAEESSPAAAGTVLRSTPAAASALPPGAVVDVVVASGSNAVPSVIGLPLDVATAAIQGAGFGVLVVSEIDRSAPTGTVLRSNPGGAADLLLGGAVTIVVAAAPPTEATPTPTPTPVPSATEAPPVIP